MNLDHLRSDVLTPAIRAGLDHFTASKARHVDARVRLEEARAALVVVAHNDPEEVTEVASAVREAEIVLEACPAPQIDAETTNQIRAVWQRINRRYLDEVGRRPHPRLFVEERNRMAPAHRVLRAAYERWAPTGRPPEDGIRLLVLASEFADAVDKYLATAPAEVIPQDALVRQAPRPVLQFVDLSIR